MKAKLSSVNAAVLLSLSSAHPLASSAEHKLSLSAERLQFSSSEIAVGRPLESQLYWIFDTFSPRVDLGLPKEALATEGLRLAIGLNYEF